ncbi:MAG TPA: adenylyl-sulfate kinase [Thermoleophilaceae bacterium]|nr:adenylyl-sulfate kinase [Thermoleophilaceae bacterium]
MARRQSPDVSWHEGRVARKDRGSRGATIWFTGLPSSGKSTIAAAVEERLVSAGRPAYRLDGDNLRHGLSGDLGFSAEDRAENVRRAGEVAALLADAGVVALVSLVSPFAVDRERARRAHEVAGLPFAEVYVSTPPAECERRDPKGLWARARVGQITGFTGVDDPYEPPSDPELTLGPELSVEAAAEEVLRWIPR